jgi:hypothetical protein
MRGKALLTFAFLFHCVVAANSQYERTQTKYSRFGEIVLFQNFSKGSHLSLNGRVIHSTPAGQHLSIKDIVQTKTRDFIVIAENFGGSGTPDDYSIVSIGENGFSKLYGQLPLVFAGEKVSFSESEGTISFRLEDEGTFERFARISKDQLTVDRKAMVRPKALSGDECQLLFTQVLSECATIPKSRDCSDHTRNLSMASLRTISAISKNIFFPVKSFEAVCEAVCRRGYVWLQYRDFASNLCHFN